MQSSELNVSQKSSSHKSSFTENLQNFSNISQDRLTGCQSFLTFQRGRRECDTTTLRMMDLKNQSVNDGDFSFYSECEQIKIDESLDDELILQKKVQKRDIVFGTKHFKESFVKYFTQVIYGFLKQPTDLSFSIAIDRLKYFSEQSPFQNRTSQTQSESTDKQNSSFNSNDSELPKSTRSNSKTISSCSQLKTDLTEMVTIQNLLRSMFYDHQHQYMIYSFDYVLCHLTFIAAMLYFWAKLQYTVTSDQMTFSRSFYVDQRKSELDRVQVSKEHNIQKVNIFKTLKSYITERAQSLNICQLNILIVYFFLNHLKTDPLFQQTTKEIDQIQQNFINNLKLFRRIKRMQHEFSSTSNQVIFQSQLHKYEYENKLIENMEKTFLIFQFLNTHTFVSSPFQKYFQLYEFESSKKNYHLKRDYFCIWVLSIILRVCEKKSAESISKSAYYIITFLAILKKFKQNKNFEGISLILPILYNIKQQLPKVWNHAANRRKQINERLKEYSQILTEKSYKKQDIPQNCNAIISEDVIYEMCLKFEKYSKINKSEVQSFVCLQKHKKFYQEFLVHIVYHRKEIMHEYADEIEDYKREKEIGISFNLYLLDTYVWKTYRGTNSKILWNILTEKSRKINEQVNYNLYIDIIDYCFIGSKMKYRQLDI